MLKKKKQSHDDVSATVADNHLVLSLPNAVEPVIWRMALDKIGSATFEVKKATKDNQYNLKLKKTKTTSETIASFDSKEDAIDALNAASDAFHGQATATLANANNNVTAHTDTHSNQASGGGKKWIFALVAALVVIGLYMYMTSLIPDVNEGIGKSPSQASSAPAAVTPQSTGVPVSADDFLNSVQ